MANVARDTDQEFQVLTQVLEAEKNAQARLDSSRTQAETILQEAQNDARRIAIRTDKRIQDLHARFRENLARKKSKLEKDFLHERGVHSKPIASGKVKEITNRLACHIIGVTQE